MPPRTIKMAIVNALQDLRTVDFERFCHQLLDRRDEPRVRRNKVEGRSIFEIADVLVSTFTEPGALRVAVDLLEQIGCNEEARELVQEAAGRH